MDFSTSQFEACLADINAGLTDFSGQLAKVGPAANQAANRWYVPASVADAITWLADQTVEVGRAIVDVIVDVLKGAIAPISMFSDAYQWMNVRGVASQVSGTLSANHLTVDDSAWSGRARDAYVRSVGVHATAGDRVGSIAGTVAGSLLGCAIAGAAFYLVVAGILVKLIAAAITSIGLFGSAVFSWAGAALLLEEAGVNTAVLSGALAALVAFLGAQARGMVELHGAAVDTTGFPGGQWPGSDTATFDDATVTDGDADWSLA